MIVLDSSSLVEVLLSSPIGVETADWLSEEASTLWAPSLIDVEVTHVLRRLVRTGEVAPAHGQAVIGLLSRFPARRADHRPLLARAWQLRESVSAYDGIYVALAESLNARLFTLDRRLSRSNGHTANIVYLGH